MQDNADLIKVYRKLSKMEQTKEVADLKEEIRENLYQNLRENFRQLTNLGLVIGFDELETEMLKTMDLLRSAKNYFTKHPPGSEE